MSATPDTHPPPAVSDLPSSRTMVWWVLHSEEELTFGGVVEATDASEPTVARSLRDTRLSRCTDFQIESRRWFLPATAPTVE